MVNKHEKKNRDMSNKKKWTNLHWDYLQKVIIEFLDQITYSPKLDFSCYDV